MSDATHSHECMGGQHKATTAMKSGRTSKKIVRVSAYADKTTKQLAEIVAQIKVLTAAVMQLMAMKENTNPNATRGNGGGDHKSR
jgi:hypothetical protein